MKSKRQLQIELHTLKDFKTIIGSYQEIAALRMRKVKTSVLQNREFLNGLSDIYQRVLVTYQLSAPKKSKSSFQIRETNGKSVSVLISANTGLYGDIIRKTYELFLNNVSNNNHDLVIVGRIGRQLYENTYKKREYTYYESVDNGLADAKIADLVNHVLKYSNIVVYHGIYQSILDQRSIATFVSGNNAINDNNIKVAELKCLIEPSIEEVLSFFEKQISSTLFEQTVHESSLSKFSSRMVSLDIANENIKSFIKKVRFSQLKVMHKSNNLQQMERLSGISLWK